MGCRNICPFGQDKCCLECPDQEECQIQCDDLDAYEFVENCPDYVKEEEEAYQIHPKKSEYVNVQENCLHLWKPVGHELGELVKGE